MGRRRGRKRKVDVAREPNGQAKRERIGPTEEWFARRSERVGKRHAMTWDGTIIGAFVCRGILAPEHQQAADKYRRIVRRYHRALWGVGAAVPKSIRALDLNMARGSELEDMDMVDFIELWNRYDGAFGALGRREEKLAVHRVMQEKWPRSGLEMHFFVRGLANLAVYFGLLGPDEAMEPYASLDRTIDYGEILCYVKNAR